MWHVIKMVLRPLFHPWILMRKKDEAARQAEYEAYRRNGEDAMAALKLELFLAREREDGDGG